MTELNQERQIWRLYRPLILKDVGAGDGENIEDMATPTRDHLSDSMFAAEVGSTQVDVDHGIPVFCAGFGERTENSAASTSDEDIDMAVGRFRLSH